MPIILNLHTNPSKTVNRAVTVTNVQIAQETKCLSLAILINENTKIGDELKDFRKIPLISIDPDLFPIEIPYEAVSFQLILADGCDWTLFQDVPVGIDIQ